MITLHPSFGTTVAWRADATPPFARDEGELVKRILTAGAGAGFVIVVTILALGCSVASLITRDG